MVFREEIGLLLELQSIVPGEDAMAFEQIAFDGSGSFGNDPVVAYGGALSTPAQWIAFSQRWAAILNREGLRYFKMTQAMSWWGEFGDKFKEWGDEREQRRDALLNELADLAVAYDFKTTGMWSDVRNLALNPTVTKKKDELFKGAMLTLLASVKAGNYVMLMLDEEGDLEDSVRSWVRKMRQQQRQSKSVAPIVGVCFVDDEAFPTIQLADMITWLFRQHGENVISASEPEKVEPSPLLKKLLHASRLDLNAVEPGQLLNGLRQYETPPTG